MDGQCAKPGLARLRIGVAEGHPVVFESHQAPIAESDTEYVWGQVLECRMARADGFDMHDPLLHPDLRWDLGKTGVLAQSPAEVAAEEARKCSDREQEVGASWQPGLS